MAVAIRLKRAGRKNTPFYHVVAADSRKPRDGRFLEKLGFYDPSSNPETFRIDRVRYAYWLERGARASRTVSQLVARLAENEGQPSS